MWANPVATMITGLLLVTIPSVLAGPGDDEGSREFGYIGSQTIDLSCCLFYRPPDLPPPVCDQTEGLLGSGIHGFGEGRFCGIQKGRAVWVSLDDRLLEPEGSVYCPTGESPYQVFGVEAPYPVTSYKKVGETDQVPAMVVPQDCMETTRKNGVGATDLLVLLRPGHGTIGTATLTFNAS